MLERGKILGIDMLQLLSRFPFDHVSSKNDFDFYGKDHDSGIWISGRSTLNLW